MKEIKRSELLSEVESIVHSQLDLNAILNNIMKTVKENGSGLGLAIVKDLVEANYGSLEVKSKINKGTTFTISFPVQAKSISVIS